MGEVIEDPHVKARETFIEREHPTAGPLTLLAPWIRMSGTPTAIQEVSPTLGQHTDDVLGGLLGLDAPAIADLRAQNAIA